MVKIETDSIDEIEELLGIEKVDDLLYFFCTKCKLEGNPARFSSKRLLEKHKLDAHSAHSAFYRTKVD